MLWWCLFCFFYQQRFALLSKLIINLLNFYCMQKKIIVGNLGSDAELRRENGREFISMSIANTERRKKDNGTYVENTTWVSATLNGNGGGLLPFLKKGVRVYAYGDYSVRMFHSEKQRALVAGVNLYIRDIELISTSTDAVPRDLYDEQGVAHAVQKYYWCPDVVKSLLYDRHGQPYLVDDRGFITPPNTSASVQVDNSAGDANVSMQGAGGSLAASSDDAESFADGQPFTGEPQEQGESAIVVETKKRDKK